MRLTGFAREPVCGGSLGRQSDGGQGGQGESHDEEQCWGNAAMLVWRVIIVMVFHRIE